MLQRGISSGSQEWLCPAQAPLVFTCLRMSWGQRLCPSAPGLGLALLLGRAAAVCAQVGTACATNQQGMRHRLLCCWRLWAGESGHDPHFQLLSEPQGSFCSALVCSVLGSGSCSLTQCSWGPAPFGRNPFPFLVPPQPRSSAVPNLLQS